MTKSRCRLLIATVPAVLLLTGAPVAAEKITFTPKGSDSYPSKPATCEIAVFQDGKPGRDYVEIGTVNYHDERHRSKDAALRLDVALPKMKAKACAVGGDALIGFRVTESRRLEWAMFNVRAIVVRYSAR
jgi:hypothetical protein